MNCFFFLLSTIFHALAKRLSRLRLLHKDLFSIYTYLHSVRCCTATSCFPLYRSFCYNGWTKWLIGWNKWEIPICWTNGMDKINRKRQWMFFRYIIFRVYFQYWNSQFCNLFILINNIDELVISYTCNWCACTLHTKAKHQFNVVHLLVAHEHYTLILNLIICLIVCMNIWIYIVYPNDARAY